MTKNKAFFDALYRQYTRKGLISPDPLEFLQRWTDVREREAGALLAACFAYGNVKAITRNLRLLFTVMPEPRRYILSATPARLKKDFHAFKYRFTDGAELQRFLLSVQRVLRRWGTLEACFLQGLDEEQETVCEGLKHFARQLRAGTDIDTLVPDPDKGSALKRLNLFLRWMVRKDAVDPGGWHISPRRLIIPLDVHIHRNARLLGLTQRNSADMKTALEITRALAQFCPQDPVKYDFCITRFGIHPRLRQKGLPLGTGAGHRTARHPGKRSQTTRTGGKHAPSAVPHAPQRQTAPAAPVSSAGRAAFSSGKTPPGTAPKPRPSTKTSRKNSRLQANPS